MSVLILSNRRQRNLNLRTQATTAATKPVLDVLEPRRLLSDDPLAVNTYRNGMDTWLNVTGTANSDAIVITRTSTTGYRITNGTWTVNKTGTFVGVRVTAGEGDDTISMVGTIATRRWFLGDAGNDSLTGGIGNDMLYGGIGTDSLNGGSGNDQLRGEAGADTITGGVGNDSIWGGADADSIAGDAGNDSILGEAGEDSIVGGDGNDTVLGGIEADSIAGGNGNDLLRGEAGNDTLNGEAGNDTLQGTGDDDSLLGGIGNDSLLGEAGNDNLSGEAGNDTLNGGIGTDLISGGTENDSLLGDADDDTLTGDAGADTLNGGLGDDSVDGGADNDRIMGDAGTDIYVGGAGSDTLDYTGRTVALVITLDGQANDGTPGENDSIGGDFEIVIGGNVADSITGSDGNDVLYGGTGNDTIDGGAGNDKLYGGNGADSILGGAGNDSIYGQADGDKLFGDAGDDLLEGGASNDQLDGGDDRDQLIAIGGGTGDSLTGGNDTDSFWLDSDSTEKLLDVSDAETAARATHRVKSFVNYGATAISKELTGQKFAEPGLTTGAKAKVVNFASRPLFGADGPAVDDVAQGQTGDCWYLASLAALAKTQPEVIRQSITSLGDGTYAVRFKSTSGADQYVRVDADLYTYTWSTSVGLYANFGSDGSTWVALMEKAFTWVRGSRLGNYSTIASGWMSEAYSRLGMSSQGRFPGQLSSASMLDWLKTQLDTGKAVTVGFNAVQSGLNLVGYHAYTVDHVTQNDDGSTSVTLRNPWGVDNSTSMDGANDGYVTLTLSQLLANFTGFAAA